MKIPEWLVKLWENADEITSKDSFDLIVPISYTTKRDTLTKATMLTARIASSWAHLHPEATLVASNCSYTFPGAADAEWGFKKAIFQKVGVKCHRAGDMNNSVQEALEIKKFLSRFLSREEKEPEKILIITGQMHSRSARFIWKKIFPKAKIFIMVFGHKNEYQKDHCVLVQQGPWRWFLANVARQILLRLIGLSISQWHHRTNT